MGYSLGKKFDRYEQYKGPEALSVRLSRVKKSVEIVGPCDIGTVEVTLHHMKAEVKRLEILARAVDATDARSDLSASQQYADAITRKQNLLALLSSIYAEQKAARDRIRDIHTGMLGLEDDYGFMLWSSGIDQHELFSFLTRERNFYDISAERDPFDVLTKVIQAGENWGNVKRELVDLAGQDWNPFIAADHVFRTPRVAESVQRGFATDYPILTSHTFQVVADRAAANTTPGNSIDIALQPYRLPFRSQIKALVNP